MFIAYVICFGVGLLFTLVSAVMGELGGGHEAHADTDLGAHGHAEAGYGGDHMPGFAPVSPTTIAAFITAFGGFGMIFHQIKLTSHPLVSASLAAVAGFLIALMVFLLFRYIFSRTQASSEARVANLIGTQGTIITPIPENGVGEIAYVNGYSRYTAPAREENGSPVPMGKPVQITRIVGSQFFVKQI